MAAFQVPSVFTAIDRLTRPIRKMGKGIVAFSRMAQNAVARVDRRFIALGRTLNTLAGGFGLFLGGAAIFAVLSSGIGIIADFEQANADLAAVMNVTVAENTALSKSAQILGAITAKTNTEVVGLQEAFARLGFERKAIINMTEATIAGAIGMNAELSDTAQLVGAMVKTFDKFSSISAPEIIDQMTLATQKSALNFEKLSVALPIVSGAANAVGVSFTKVNALLGILSDAGIDASMSSTALRNIFIESAKRGVPFEKILAKISTSTNKLTLANKIFGKRGAVAAVILSKNIQKTAELNAILKKAAAGQELAGVAQLAAGKRLETLKGRVTLLKSAYSGFITSLEDGTGPFADTLKLITDVTAAVFLMGAGGDIAKRGLAKTNKEIIRLAKNTIVAIKWIGIIVGSFIALKVVIGIITTLMAAWTLVVGAATAATAAFGVVMTIITGPVGLIIAAVIALIALTTAIIKNWDDWGAAVTIFLGPLGLVITMVQSFRRNWDALVKAFKTGGILSVIKAIALVIADGLLMPIEQLLRLFNRFTGIDLGIGAIAAVREAILTNLNTLGGDATPSVNPPATEQSALIERSESVQEQRLKLLIESDQRVSIAEDSTTGVAVELPSTLNFD